jgi:beta-N-acetylhexosaminidase
MNPAAFSDEQLAGQRLMVGFEGTSLNKYLKFLIQHLKVGGVILFAGNIETPDQLKKLCLAIQDCAHTHNQPPLFIAIDQEGGHVARLKEPFTQFPGNPAMKGEEDAAYFAEITAMELCRVGINMNLAPVMDIAPKEIESIMVKRSFGDNPAWVTRMGVKVIEHLQQNKIMAVAKHFPGIGRTVLDSHIDLPTFDANLAELESYDLIPFKAGIHKKVSGIMLAHILYQKLDPKWPASLSRHIAWELLRNRMGFGGISMTDDLDMGAIAKHYDIKTAIHQILSADIDIALVCHQGPNIEIAYEEILGRLKGSSELKSKGIDSLKRILKLKKTYLGI